MILKAIFLPLGLIILFGGGYVAATKPFNPRTSGVVIGLGLAVLLLGIASGWPKWLALLFLLVAIGAFIFRSSRR
jgi:hypothetical protein